LRSPSDQNSSTGTSLNGIQLEPNKSYHIAHNDLIQIGENCLRLHIHAGTTTCIDCEPGEVMAKLNEKRRLQQNSAKTTCSKNSVERQRREINKDMKKK